MDVGKVKPNVEIKEAYKDYAPPINVYSVIQTLVCYVPQKYLHGLKYVVLTNTSTLPRNRRRSKTLSRNHRVKIVDSHGLYHQEWKGEPAWIEIFVDNITNYYPAILLRFPLLRNMIFADVFYHEIGHHIHKTIIPKYQEREDVAEKWSSKLGALFFRKKYWYFLPLLYPLIYMWKINRKFKQAMQRQKE